MHWEIISITAGQPATQERTGHGHRMDNPCSFFSLFSCTAVHWTDRMPMRQHVCSESSLSAPSPCPPATE
eukprot:scaffold180063_cov18-Prasinocladus_malaysianus.AAC.3